MTASNSATLAPLPSPSRTRGPTRTTSRRRHQPRAPLAHPLPEPLALEAVALGLELGQAGLEAGVALELGELLGAGLGALALELGGAVAGLLGQALLGALAGLALAVHVGASAALGVAGAGVGLVDGQAGLFALAPGLLVQAGLFLAGVLAQLLALELRGGQRPGLGGVALGLGGLGGGELQAQGVELGGLGLGEGLHARQLRGLGVALGAGLAGLVLGLERAGLGGLVGQRLRGLPELAGEIAQKNRALHPPVGRFLPHDEGGRR